MTVANFMTLQMKATAENVGLARLAVAVFASNLDFTIAEIDEIKVAVSEAVTNAVVHAYPDAKQPGSVVVSAEIRDGRLIVQVADQGVGIEDLAKAREHGYSSDPERLGMGFYFMETLMDTVDIVSAPGQGTRVRLARRPAQSPHDERERRPAVS